MRVILLLALTLLFSSCVKHEDKGLIFKEIHDFSGRLLVMTQTKRVQAELDWQGDASKGVLRITHGASGRIIDVKWQDQKMIWRDSSESPLWGELSQEGLYKLGIILMPWDLARVFRGDLPPSMLTKDQRTWKGHWDSSELQIRWSSEQKKVDLMDMKKGQRIVVFFND